MFTNDQDFCIVVCQIQRKFVEIRDRKQMFAQIHQMFIGFFRIFQNVRDVDESYITSIFFEFHFLPFYRNVARKCHRDVNKVCQKALAFMFFARIERMTPEEMKSIVLDEYEIIRCSSTSLKKLQWH